VFDVEHQVGGFGDIIGSLLAEQGATDHEVGRVPLLGRSSSIDGDC
jgi:hypothetical protein